MRIHHVSLPIPAGAQDVARAFYGSVLGLREIPIPESLELLHVAWFAVGSGDTELHLLPDISPDPSAGRHFGLIVPDLEEAWRRLENAGFESHSTIAIPGRPRFYCRDPFSNLIECMQIHGDYLDDLN